MRRRAGIAVALVAMMAAVPLTTGAASASGIRDAGICIPLIYCPQPAPAPTQPAAPADPDPSPSPEESAGPSTPVAPTTPADPAEPEATPAPVDPVAAPVDASAPVFTGVPASMGSESLSFTGLRGISIVSVPTVDGGSVRALKISADSITITGFSLTVRPPDGPGLVTTADTMSLQGDVTVYIGSITASSLGGAPLTIGTDTPPPLTDVEPGLLNVSMGLVGSIADLITYTNTDQRIVEAP
jgi:hypothetical protein